METHVKKLIASHWAMLPLVCFVALPSFAATINVFAAASLTESLKEIAAAYERQSGDKVVFNFGASSFLARQIEEGAPADIFFSADEARMDGLEKGGLIVKETRKSRLSNSLVIVIAADNSTQIHSANDLTNASIKRVALADPKTAPAGIYAKQFLAKTKLWSAVEKKVVPTDNVRAALSAVESGNVEVGIVYKTDADISKKVKVAYEVPVKEGPAISYPMALIKDSKDPAASRKFLQYLESDDAGRVFEKFGFIVCKPSRAK
jgi:molybdate transport system substrate-binding protein